jgi:hypothetical protein
MTILKLKVRTTLTKRRRMILMKNSKIMKMKTRMKTRMKMRMRMMKEMKT